MSEDIPHHPLDDPSAHPDALLRILDLETLDRDLFRSTFLFADRYALYGGQVAAQALIAAGRTVAADRPVHSLHGYFLSSGDASRPIVFHVYRDRDGRTYSARRVVAVQNGEVIFNMSASFHASDAGPDEQVTTMPTGIAPPEESEPFDPMRLFSYDARLPPSEPAFDFPRLFWARATVPLPDDALVHSAVLTYLSDISSGLMTLHSERARSTSSLDHAVWFHRPVRADDWVLSDLRPHSAAEGRGWYTGSMFDRDGRLVASLAQEALFRFTR